MLLFLLTPYLSLLWTLLVESIMTRTIDQYDVMNWFVFCFSILSIFIFNHSNSKSILFEWLRGIVFSAIQSCLRHLINQCLCYKRFFCKQIFRNCQQRFSHQCNWKKRRNNIHPIQQMAVGLLCPIHDLITNTSVPSSRVRFICKHITQFILNCFGWMKCLHIVHEPVISTKRFWTPKDKKKRQAVAKKLK